MKRVNAAPPIGTDSEVLADGAHVSLFTFHSSSQNGVSSVPIVRHLGMADYEPILRAMQDFTAARRADTPDEIWLLQHPPVYTVGIAGREQHLPRVDNGIPVIRIDRGGQITYHGPGQIVAYLLLDMRRRAIGVRSLVRLMENAVIRLLAGYDIIASGRVDAPGVYVGCAKVAALGLRIKHGCCYHGLALNVDMELQPFEAIDPCGYRGLPVTHLRALGVSDPLGSVSDKLLRCLLESLETH